MTDETKLKIIDEAWMGLGQIDESKLFNPMSILNSSDPDYHLKLTWLITQPEYFSFLCKQILNIDIIPSQALILDELWNRRFPMLIASRGFGKAERLTNPILTEDGWVPMGDIKIGSKVYGRDGKLHNVVQIHPQGKKQVFRVHLADGRYTDCCEDHLWSVTHQTTEKTLSVKQMLDSGLYYFSKSTSGTGRIRGYKYKVPNCEPIDYNDNRELPIDPYILGCLLGDGCVTTATPKIASDDDFIINEFKERLEGFEIKKDPTNNNYTIVDRNKVTTHCYRNGKKVKCGSRNRLTTLLRDNNLNKKCHDKYIPEIYKTSSIENRLELIRGLMDTDGSVCEGGAIEFTNVNERLIDDTIDILRSLGIRCQKAINDRSGQFHQMPQGNTRERSKYFRVFINTSQSIFKLPRKLERLKTKPTRSEKYVPIVNIERLDEYAEMQCITVDNPDHTYITKDYIVTHNSFILSVYAILRALLLPKRKVIIVGSAFRQSKILFEYMEGIWNNSPILRSMCTSNCGPRREVDRCILKIHESRVICLPLGDGCLSEGTLVTYKNRFGYIEQTGDSIWGNKKFRDIDTPHDNGIKDTLTITTKMGFEYSGTLNHKMKIVRDSNIIWCRTDEMQIGDRILIDRSNRWHSGEIDNITLDQCYALGAMLGDGNYTNKYRLRFATKDSEIINRINASFIRKKFSQCGDEVHWDLNNKDEVSNWLNLWGMDHTHTINKKIPDKAMRSSREQMTEILKGLFDTDGFVTHSENRGSSTYVGFTNTSKVLVQQIQYILLHYGIVAKVFPRKRNKNWNTSYELLITGNDTYKFKSLIGFHLKRKYDILQNAKQTKSIMDGVPVDKNLVMDFVSNDGATASPSIIKRKQTLTHAFLKDTIHKSNKPRQDWFQLVDDDIYYDTITSISETKHHTYDMHVPDGNEYCANGFFSHNSKIRGQRSNDILADEFASIPRDIFETVVVGFGAVSSSPIENVKRIAAEKKAQELGIKINEKKTQDVGVQGVPNQMILSGTAYYDFNHFASYWKNWHKIILSKGDPKKLADVFGEDQAPDDFSWKDYSIIRIPYELLPEGFMDAAQVARSKATIHNGIYQMEYGAVFTSDSQGFFKRSLIESCVASEQNDVRDTRDQQIVFSTKLIGDHNKRYVFGIDPASEIDNFSIIILEVNNDHRRIVYCWTTNRSEHKEKVKKGYVKEKTYYEYCARKIRDLMRLFPCIHIAMDKQGGGVAVMEALHEEDKLQQGEVPIWPIIDEDNPQDTDDEKGLHILELCNNVKYEWYTEANHGLRKDLEDKALLFPAIDEIGISIANAEDSLKNRMYDTAENLMLEIEELKNEMAMIQMSQTPQGRDKWDTPEVIVGAGKKEKMRKDRYSALMMANMAARQMARMPTPTDYNFYGGFATMRDDVELKPKQDLYNGPNWFTDGMKDIY